MATPVPVVPAPPGVIPDFDTPNIWLRTANLVLVVVGLAISTSCLVMRTYTKARIIRNLWWDDFCIIVAWIFAVITQTLILCEFSLLKKGLYLSGLQMAIIMGLESIFGT
jgi:hypothetical protein